jgi:hypothetical protein
MSAVTSGKFKLTSAPYNINTLSLAKGETGADAYGINDKGEIVGTSYVAGSSYSQTAAIWQLNSKDTETKRIDAVPPKGYLWSSLNAVNDAGVAVGAVTGSGEAYRPAYYHGGTWHLLQGNGGTSIGGRAVAITSGGTIAGSVSSNPAGLPQAAVFAPQKSGKYGPAQLLPSPPGSLDAIAGAVFSLPGLTLVGGGVQGGHPIIATSAYFWINGGGPYLIDTSSLKCPSPLAPNYQINGIYATDKADIVVVGSGCQDTSAFPLVSKVGFYAVVEASSAEPKIGKVHVLPVPAGLTAETANAIGATPGPTGAMTIAGTATTSGGTYAAIWIGSVSKGNVLFRKFTDLTFAKTAALRSGDTCSKPIAGDGAAVSPNGTSFAGASGCDGQDKGVSISGVPDMDLSLDTPDNATVPAKGGDIGFSVAASNGGSATMSDTAAFFVTLDFHAPAVIQTTDRAHCDQHGGMDLYCITLTPLAPGGPHVTVNAVLRVLPRPKAGPTEFTAFIVSNCQPDLDKNRDCFEHGDIAVTYK